MSMKLETLLKRIEDVGADGDTFRHVTLGIAYDHKWAVGGARPYVTHLINHYDRLRKTRQTSLRRFRKEGWKVNDSWTQQAIRHQKVAQLLRLIWSEV